MEPVQNDLCLWWESLLKVPEFAAKRIRDEQARPQYGDSSSATRDLGSGKTGSKARGWGGVARTHCEPVDGSLAGTDQRLLG